MQKYYILITLKRGYCKIELIEWLTTSVNEISRAGATKSPCLSAICEGPAFVLTAVRDV